MARSLGVLVACALLISAPVAASAQPAEAQETDLPRSPEPAPQLAPPPAAPAEAPPSPPFADEAHPAPAASVPPGQWVYTQQYGWVWMPYPDDYTYVPPDGYGEPYVYAYYPVYGWTWLVAPWVWGFGPWPYFGVRGAVHFAWYRHGWWRSPWRWHFAPSPHFVYHGVRPMPHGVRPTAPHAFVWRGAPGRAVAPPRVSGGHSGGVRHGGRR